MKIIDLEAHFYTNDYLKYLRSRKDPPFEEVREKNIHLRMASGVTADLIAFGADHPFETSKESLESLGVLPICEADKEKFFHGNAEKLLKL